MAKYQLSFQGLFPGLEAGWEKALGLAEESFISIGCLF